MALAFYKNGISRKQYLKRMEALWSERSSYDALYRSVAQHIAPRRTRFEGSERGRPADFSKIINSTPVQALRTMAAGVSSGLTSPSRPWFKLTTPDPELAEFHSVKEYLRVVELRLRMLFAKSNIYEALAAAYVDLGGFGTTALHIDADESDVLRARVHAIGSYAVALRSNGRADTCYSRRTLTVGQMVEEFEGACSKRVLDAYARGDVDDTADVLHVIEPNWNFEEAELSPRRFPYRSVWLEIDAPSNHDTFLRVKGFYELPTMIARWDVTADDAYGQGPGFMALGDARALQQTERRKAQAVDKIVAPPLLLPPSARRSRISLLAGDVSYGDLGANGRAEPLVVINPAALTVAGEYAREHERHIASAFYADLWNALISIERGKMTATEVDARSTERLQLLGPTVERLQDELLDPLIDRAFGIAHRAGELPEPPRELAGSDLRVEYVSVMAQAQRLVSVSAIDRVASFVMQTASVAPQVLETVNWDQMINEYAAAVGAPSNILLAQEVVRQARAKREEAQQAAQQAEQLQQESVAVRNLAAAPLGDQGDSALSRLAAGYGAPDQAVP